MYRPAKSVMKRAGTPSRIWSLLEQFHLIVIFLNKNERERKEGTKQNFDKCIVMDLEV